MLVCDYQVVKVVKRLGFNITKKNNVVYVKDGYYLMGSVFEVENVATLINGYYYEGGHYKYERKGIVKLIQALKDLKKNS